MLLGGHFIKEKDTSGEIERRKHGIELKIGSQDCRLNETIAKYLYPRLMKYKSMCIGYEVGNSVWYDKLDKMIYAFDIIAGDKWNTKKASEYREQESKVKEGLELFAKHYLDLWI